MNISNLVKKAKTSSFYLKLLNFGLSRMVPFNKPHGFKIIEIGDHHLKATIPYKKANFNHIKGIHACALATLSEFVTGFLLLTKLNPSSYRLIMQKLMMEYHYQARMDAYAYFSIDDEWIQSAILNPLNSEDKVSVDCVVKVMDCDGNHLSTGTISWQIKKWDKVKTKV